MSTSVVSETDPSTKWVKWIVALLVIAIAYAAASLTIQLLPTTKVSRDGPAVQVRQSPGTTSLSPTKLGEQVVSSHLFGKAGQKPVKKVEEAPKEAPETKLNLTLAGVFAYKPEERAIAIISPGGREQNVYGIGDKIVGNAVLKAVYEDRVIIENRGKEETLKLPEDVAPIALPRVSASSSNTGSSSRAPVELPDTPRALRDKLVKNPSMLGKIVSASPYQQDGKLVGFKLQPKQNPEILEAQGIMANDVITKVNGISLNSQKQGIRALRKLVKASNIELTVLRDGIEIPVSISLEQ